MASNERLCQPPRRLGAYRLAESYVVTKRGLLEKLLISEEEVPQSFNLDSQKGQSIWANRINCSSFDLILI